MIRTVAPVSVIGFALKTERGVFLVPKGDAYVARRMAQGGHDDHVLAEAVRLTRAGDQVLIVGAHVGAHAVPLAKLERSVVAVEANPDTFELLELNCAINSITAQVRLVNSAAGRTAGVAEFWQGHANTGGSKVRPSRRRFEYVFDCPTRVTVPTVMIDDLKLATQRRLAVAIIDVEGSEGAALAGMARTLPSCDALIMEVCPAHLEDAGDMEAVQALLQAEFDEAVVLVDGRRLDISSLGGAVRSEYGQFAACDVVFTRSG